MKIRPELLPWGIAAGLPALGSYAWWLIYGGLFSLGFFIVFMALTAYLLYFFRDPERAPHAAAMTDWLAPADGLVREVVSQKDGTVRIVIFLSVFNVHVNRLPVAGKLERIEYAAGQFLPAFSPGVEGKNERNILYCRDTRGRNFQVWQIAGLIARRIHCWVEPGEALQRGERFGMIALGSRTDLVLPEGVEPAVNVGEIVRAGQTVVAVEEVTDD